MAHQKKKKIIHKWIKYLNMKALFDILKIKNIFLVSEKKRFPKQKKILVKIKTN